MVAPWLILETSADGIFVLNQLKQRGDVKSNVKVLDMYQNAPIHYQANTTKTLAWSMSTAAKEKHAAKGYEELAAPGIMRWTSEVKDQDLPLWFDTELMGKSTLSPKGESSLVSL